MDVHPTRTALRRLETGRLAERVKEALLDSIRAGGFADGSLPSEDRLADELGVSRTTVREALRSLEEEGVITRRRGIGTRVNVHVVRTTSLNRAAGFYDLIRTAGHDPEIAWTRVGRAPAEAEVAERLGREAGTELVTIERLFLADRDPVVHLVEHVPDEELAGPVEPARVPESIFAFSDACCRSPIDHTVVELQPAAADEAVGSALALEPGQPVLRLLETHYSADGRPLVVSLIHSNDRLLRFSVVRKRM